MSEPEQNDFPRPVPDVADHEIVQVLMPRGLARAFERRCLPVVAQLVGPLEFSEDDVPTFIISLAPDDRRWWLWRLGPLAAWSVGDPPASARRNPALEMVAVMPVAEHEADPARLEAENARLREAAQAVANVFADMDDWTDDGRYAAVLAALRAALAPAADEGAG